MVLTVESHTDIITQELDRNENSQAHLGTTESETLGGDSAQKSVF